VRIEPAKRAYSDAEAARLLDLFGPRERWRETQRSLLWAHASLALPAFEGSVATALHVTWPFDPDNGAAKYFDALEGGTVPLLFLFSGTVFLRGDGDALRVAPIPWEREASFELPVAAWRALLEHHHPGTRALSVREELFERLRRFKTERGLPTFDRALEELLR
jgi:hypothetical protein